MTNAIPRVLCHFLLFPAALVLWGQSAAHAARLALVFGNDQYRHVTQLHNAVADAETMAVALGKAGYRVTLVTNRDLKAMQVELRDFRSRIQGGDEVVVFFSGHGVELDGENFLTPVDVRSDSEDKVLRLEALPLGGMLADIRSAKPAFALVILDACRDNPFKKAGRAIGGRGLSPMVSSAAGEMVIFAAGAGERALDRLGSDDPVKNGVFTRIFVKEMERPGVPVHQVLKNVQEKVALLAEKWGHKQLPAMYDQVRGAFYFYPVPPNGIVWTWPGPSLVLKKYGGGTEPGLVELGGTRDQPVLAAADGRVVYSGPDLRGYGRQVTIKHDATFVTVYAYCRDLLVKEGDTVVRGQQISTMGNSDSDSGRAKLYFELRREGRAVDPLPYMSAK